MSYIQCENGHYYNDEVYDSCPYCTGGMEIAGDVTMPYTESEVTEKDIYKTERRAREDILGDRSLDQDKTISVWSMTANTADMLTEPVTGWLVCIRGADIGKDFRLCTGKNYVGRSDQMDIVLRDEAVSRDRHVILVFEPKQNIFLVQPGESRGLTYLNDMLILQPQILKQGDRITIGGSELLFVPLCQPDGFHWEPYIK